MTDLYIRGGNGEELLCLIKPSLISMCKSSPPDKRKVGSPKKNLENLVLPPSWPSHIHSQIEIMI